MQGKDYEDRIRGWGFTVIVSNTLINLISMGELELILSVYLISSAEQHLSITLCRLTLPPSWTHTAFLMAFLTDQDTFTKGSWCRAKCLSVYTPWPWLPACVCVSSPLCMCVTCNSRAPSPRVATTKQTKHHMAVRLLTLLFSAGVSTNKQTKTKSPQKCLENKWECHHGRVKRGLRGKGSSNRRVIKSFPVY